MTRKLQLALALCLLLSATSDALQAAGRSKARLRQEPSSSSLSDSLSGSGSLSGDSLSGSASLSGSGSGSLSLGEPPIPVQGGAPEPKVKPAASASLSLSDSSAVSAVSSTSGSWGSGSANFAPSSSSSGSSSSNAVDSEGLTRATPLSGAWSVDCPLCTDDILARQEQRALRRAMRGSSSSSSRQGSRVSATDAAIQRALGGRLGRGGLGGGLMGAALGGGSGSGGRAVQAQGNTVVLKNNNNIHKLQMGEGADAQDVARALGTDKRSSGRGSSSGSGGIAAGSSESRKAFVQNELAKVQLPAGATMTHRLRAAFKEAAEKRWDEQKLKSANEELTKKVLKDNEKRVERERARATKQFLKIKREADDKNAKEQDNKLSERQAKSLAEDSEKKKQALAQKLMIEDNRLETLHKERMRQAELDRLKAQTKQMQADAELARAKAAALAAAAKPAVAVAPQSSSAAAPAAAPPAAPQRIEVTSEKALLANKNFKPVKSNKLAAASKMPPKTGKFSYLFWLRIESINDEWTQLFQKGNDAQARVPAVFVKYRTSKLHIRSGTSRGWNTGFDSADVPLKQWTHVTITHEEGALKAFFNGKAAGERALPAPKENDDDLWTCNPRYEGADAQLADFRVVNYVVTPSEIETIMKLKNYS